MKRARFNDKQILAVLMELMAGAQTSDRTRKYDVQEPIIYNWKIKWGEV